MKLYLKNTLFFGFFFFLSLLNYKQFSEIAKLNTSNEHNILGFNKQINIFWEKLHFTILNYTLNYILHRKLFECTFCSLNYDPCYTLHPDVNFTIILDGSL